MNQVHTPGSEPVSPRAKAARTDGLSLRIANWNVHWMHDDHLGRERRLVEELGRYDFDVICLQESWTESEDSQAERFAAELGYAYYAYLPVRWLGERSQGQAVLSRHPISETHAVEIPDETMHRRGCTAVVETALGRLPILSAGLWGNVKIAWHLPVIADRLQPYRTIVRHLESIDSALPPLIGADLNAEPDSGELRWLTGADAGAAGDAGRELYFVDTGRRDESAGYTIDTSTNPLATFAPGRWRTDYLLAGTAPRDRYSYGWTVARCGRLGVELDRPASDHYGVWSELRAAPLPTAPPAAWRSAHEPPSTGRTRPRT
ncbi:endonuclease/exonuclease/phosphatase family protein [Streptomyces sp. NPDC004752]